MKEEFKDFLKYGIEQTIGKKQLLEVNFLLLLFTLVTMIIGRFSIMISAISVMTLISCCILTYSKQEVTGKKVFWIYGIWSVSLSIEFALLGTCIILLIIDKKYYLQYGIILFLMYLVAFILYTAIIICLIRREAYKKLQQTNKRIPFILIGIFGISIAKIFAKNTGYKSILQIASICCYTFSVLALLGVFNLFKYYYLTKYSF